MANNLEQSAQTPSDQKVDAVNPSADKSQSGGLDSLGLLAQYAQVKETQAAALTDQPAGAFPNPTPLEPVQTCPASPDYQKYIDVAARNIYDPKQLGDIRALEHKYDCEIHNTDDIFKYASAALEVTGDPYDTVMNPMEARELERLQKGGYAGIGAQIVNADPSGMHPGAASTAIRNPFPGKPAERAGLQSGDGILSVDGKDVHALPVRDVADALTAGPPGSKVDIVVDRSGKHLEKVITREAMDTPPVVHDKDIGNGIAYIKIDNFADGKEAQQLAAALERNKNARAFVIDVRNNGGGLVGQALQSAELFVKKGPLMSISVRDDSPPDKPVYDQQQLSLDEKNLNISVTRSDTGAQTTKSFSRVSYSVGDKPVVLLTNEKSASASEIFTGALHDTAHDTTVGATTYGKGIGQNVIKNMPDDGYLKVTSLHYLTPSGLWPGDAGQNRIGIRPDIPAGILDGVLFGSPEDTQLSAAVDYLKKYKLQDQPSNLPR